MTSKLSVREFSFFESDDGNVIFYQADILRMIRHFERVGCKFFADKLKRIIYLRDLQDKTKTNLDEKQNQNDIAMYVMSPMDYEEYINYQREIDKDMREFYGKKTKGN